MFGAVQGFVLYAIWIILLIVKVYAFIDCARRPAAAFPAVGRQSKILWVLLTGLAALLGLIPDQTLGLLGIAGTVIALIYIFDVRVRITEIMGR